MFQIISHRPRHIDGKTRPTKVDWGDRNRIATLSKKCNNIEQTIGTRIRVHLADLDTPRIVVVGHGKI